MTNLNQIIEKKTVNLDILKEEIDRTISDAIERWETAQRLFEDADNDLRNFAKKYNISLGEPEYDMSDISLDATYKFANNTLSEEDLDDIMDRLSTDSIRYLAYADNHGNVRIEVSLNHKVRNILKYLEKTGEEGEYYGEEI